MKEPIKKIDFKLTNTTTKGLMHDSRADARTLIKVVNILMDKVNELVEEVNTLKKLHEPKS